MDFRNPKTGTYYQPINDPAHGTVCEEDEAARATRVGTAMDVIGPGTNDDFREFGLAIQDFVSLHKAGPDGEPDDQPPAAPEHFPDDDPGVMGINYRNAPFQLRETKNGTPVDPAYTFSSWVFGDPKTPLLEAYSNDPVRMRLIQGSQEEQHVFGVQGMRWREEPDDPNSSLVNAEAIGISEAFNFQLRRPTAAPLARRSASRTCSTEATPQMTCTWARGASCGCAARGDPCYRCRTTRCKICWPTIPCPRPPGTRRPRVPQRAIPARRARRRATTRSWRWRPTSSTTSTGITTPSA